MKDKEPVEALVDMEDPENAKFDLWTIKVEREEMTFYLECDRSKVLRTKFETMKKKLLIVQTSKDH